MADVASRFASGSWAFTPEVVDVFDAHVEASVPYYGAIQSLVAEASDWLAPAGSLIADLGASTGTTVAAIQTRHPDRRLQFVLYDEEAGMLARAREKLEALPASVGASRTSFRYEDRAIQRGPLPHKGAALTTALFTLQFLSPAERRRALIAARYAAADDGSILVAEKLRLEDSRWAEMAAEASWDFKQAAGIPADAVRAKARALRGVLRPLTAVETEALLVGCGWAAPVVLFRWHQWVLWGAFAAPVVHDDLLAELSRDEVA